MIIITTLYVLNFYLNDRYSIIYSLYKNFPEKPEEYNKTEELNPKLNFTIEIFKITEEFKMFNVSERFFILDSDNNFINSGGTFTGNPEDCHFTIGYVCTFNCSFEENEDINDSNNIVYFLRLKYSGYKIDHQSKDIPLEKNNDKYSFYNNFYFSFTKTSLFFINWTDIKYREERGLLALFDRLLNKKYEYTSTDINSIQHFLTEQPIERSDEIFDIFTVRYLATFEMKNEHNQYIEYVRIKKSILEVFAEIGSLFSTLFSVFSFIFSLYSENFDNYTIIKRVVSNSNLLKKIIKNNKKSRNDSIKFEDISLKIKQLSFSKDIISVDSNQTNPISNKKTIIKENEKVWNFGKIKHIYFILANINIINEKGISNY